MENCIFCKIVSRQIPGYIVRETEDVIVFLSRENHPLVVPKKHIADIYGLDEGTGHKLMDELTRASRAVKRALGCDGIYLKQANEPAAGQEVFHLHFHVYPRWQGQAMNQTEVIADEERQKTMQKIEAAYEP